MCSVTYTDGNAECNGDSHGNCDTNSNRNSHRYSYSYADGLTNTDTVRRKMYSDAAASSDSSSSAIELVAASLCEAETWDDCKRG